MVIAGDVGDLYKTPLVPDSLAAFSDDCHAGSASKSLTSRMENRYGGRLNLKHPEIASAEMNPLTCTFSTGVFLTADVDIWRKEGIANKVLSLAQANEKYCFVWTDCTVQLIDVAEIIFVTENRLWGRREEPT